MTDKLMPSVLDREIRSATDDAFGHRHFAEALRSLVEDKTHTPPYTVGLLGTWGRGKSTTKELYLSDLKKDVSQKGGSGPTRRERIRLIVFNAWRHGGEDIKRALLRTIFIALGGTDDDLHRKFYCQIERITPERKPLKDLAIEVADKWVVPIVALIIVHFTNRMIIQKPNQNSLGCTTRHFQTPLYYQLKQLLICSRHIKDK